MGKGLGLNCLLTLCLAERTGWYVSPKSVEPLCAGNPSHVQPHSQVHALSHGHLTDNHLAGATMYPTCSCISREAVGWDRLIPTDRILFFKGRLCSCEVYHISQVCLEPRRATSIRFVFLGAVSSTCTLHMRNNLSDTSSLNFQVWL